MHAIENAKVATPATAVALQTQLQLQLPESKSEPEPGPRPRDINKTRQLRIAAILVSMPRVDGVCPILGSEQCGGSCAFDCLIKAVGLGALDMLDALLCNGRRMRLAAAATALATLCRALPLLFIESAWTADDKNKTFKCA